MNLIRINRNECRLTLGELASDFYTAGSKIQGCLLASDFYTAGSKIQGCLLASDFYTAGSKIQGCLFL